MSAKDLCPSRQEMEQLLLGQLPDERTSLLEAHLEDCVGCQQQLAQVHVDSLLTRVIREKSSGPASSPALDIDGLLERLNQFYSPASSSVNGSEEVQADAGSLAFLAPPQTTDEIGRLGRYRVLRLLGRGGMGLVFQAEDLQLERMVALKIMRPKVAKDPISRERFLREARAMAAIKHDHIVTIFEVDEARYADGSDSIPFLAMEILEGESLASWLREHARPPVELIVRIGRQAAAGLAAAHARGLIHRDIKPANLWLEAVAGGQWPVARENQLGAEVFPNAPSSLTTDHWPLATARVKLVDFGLVYTLPESDGSKGLSLTAPEIMGTPAYMAPEQKRGETLDARCDLFALGCVLYEMCTGTLPFPAEGRTDLKLALEHQSPRPVDEVNSAVPPALAELIGQLLAEGPANRPASARAVEQTLADIERQMIGSAESGFQKTQADVSLGRPRRRHLAWFYRTVTVALIASLSFLLLWFGLPWLEEFPRGEPDENWRQWVQRLPRGRQAAAVAAKLEELNKGFSRQQVVSEWETGSVSFPTDFVTDLRPLQGLTWLRHLRCAGSMPGAGRLTDLSPLAGLKLESLVVWYNPLLEDFRPLRKVPLVKLEAPGTGLRSLGEFDGSELEHLVITETKVEDLAPIKHMPKLRFLFCLDCNIKSLEPLAQSNVEELAIKYDLERDREFLRSMPKLRMLNFTVAKDQLGPEQRR